MTTLGPVAFATFSDDASVGTVTWTNPGNAAVSDNIYATATFSSSGGSTSTTHYLKVLNASSALSSLPDNATINGITISIERKANSSGSSDNVTDSTVRLVVGGTISGANKADTVTQWPSADTVVNYGSSSDLWSLTGLTGADLKSTTFGIVLSVNIHSSFSFSEVASVDAITLTVDYTAITTSNRALSPTAALQARVTRTVAPTAALTATSMRTVAPTAGLKATVARIIASTALLTQRFSRSITPTATLQATPNRVISPTVVLNGASRRAITSSVWLVYDERAPLLAPTRTDGATHASGRAAVVAVQATTDVTGASQAGASRAVLTTSGATKARIIN